MTLALCFGQFGPYHHARVAALQAAARQRGAGGKERGAGNQGWGALFCIHHSNLAHGLQTMCAGTDE
jgi:hypothetical protein